MLSFIGVGCGGLSSAAANVDGEWCSQKGFFPEREEVNEIDCRNHIDLSAYWLQGTSFLS
jgi:hypothetical protein